MKKVLIGILFGGLALVMGVVLVARGHTGGSLYAGAVNEAKAGGCQGQHTDHLVVLENEQPNPKKTEAKRCDTLTLKNEDDTARLIAFGPHEKHIDYSGVDEQYVYGGKQLKLVMLETGTYEYHDHLRDVMVGEITVTN